MPTANPELYNDAYAAFESALMPELIPTDFRTLMVRESIDQMGSPRDNTHISSTPLSAALCLVLAFENQWSRVNPDTPNPMLLDEKVDQDLYPLVNQAFIEGNEEKGFEIEEMKWERVADNFPGGMAGFEAALASQERFVVQGMYDVLVGSGARVPMPILNYLCAGPMLGGDLQAG